MRYSSASKRSPPICAIQPMLSSACMHLPTVAGWNEAPELTKDMRLAYAGQSLVPVGSKAVLNVIEKYQPLLGLHGHIHEGKGSRKIKRTLCINPGSMYEQELPARSGCRSQTEQDQ